MTFEAEKIKEQCSAYRDNFRWFVGLTESNSILTGDYVKYQYFKTKTEAQKWANENRIESGIDSEINPVSMGTCFHCELKGNCEYQPTE